MLDLSVIIVSFNNKKLLEECLYSIYARTHKITFEVIVVDNNSTDGSPAMVAHSFPAAIIIENKENLGFSRANNQGLRIYKGRYALLLNNDTVVQDYALDQMVEFMDKSEKAGACGPKLLNVDGNPQRQGGLFGPRFWRAEKPAEANFVIGACLMVRREVVDRVGLMDENLFFYNDDLDWCLRIRRAGWKIYFLPQARVIHYGGYSSKQKFNRRLFVEGFKGGLYFTRKHYGEWAYQSYRLCLSLSLCLCLPFLLCNPEKMAAYMEIIKIAFSGSVPEP